MDRYRPFEHDPRALRTPIRTPRLSSTPVVEPKSDYLQLKLRERRQDLGAPYHQLRSLSLSEPRPPPAMDDYIFESEGEARGSRRRLRGRRDRIVSAGSQSSQSRGLGSREQQTNQDRLSKDNFDLKLRLTLVEELNHTLQAQADDAQASLKRMEMIQQERDDLQEQNLALLHHVDEHRLSREDCERKLRDSWKMMGEVFAELESRDVAIKEALDMYMDSECRVQELKAELAKYTSVASRRDSSYSSAGPDFSGARPNDDNSRPASSQTGDPSDCFDSTTPSPERSDTVADLATSRPLSQRYSRLVRTVSAGDLRVNDLRERASSAKVPGPAADESDSRFSSPVQRRLTLRRSSRSPRVGRAASKASSSNNSRGLRGVYLEDEQQRASPALSESANALSEMAALAGMNSSQHPTDNFDAMFGKRIQSPLSQSPVLERGRSSEIKSVTDSELCERALVRVDSRDSSSDITQFDDEQFTGEAPGRPTTLQSDRYCRWSEIGRKCGALGQDLLFDAELADDFQIRDI